MLSNRAATAPTGATGAPADVPVPLWQPVLAFLAVAAVLYLVMGAVAPHLPEASGPKLAPPFTGPSWLRGWAQWDSGWYERIASSGYSFVHGEQSTVAFFPAYPLVMRVFDSLTGNTYVAGIIVTFVCGAGVAALLFLWLRDRLSPAAAWTALAAYLLFPYAFFLYGVVYADALFIAALLGAFLLLEADRPVLAGVVGAVATAARPVGIVLVAGLVVRALERRGALRPFDLRRLRAADAGVLLSLLGLAAWCVYLWARFGDPLAFASAQSAWHQGAGPSTWLKFQFFHDVTDLRSPGAWVLFMAHPVLTVAAACFLPRVFRRFGVGYGVFAASLIGLSAISTKNFFGMARYLLAAFPVFAVAGELLVERTRLRQVALAVSALGLVVLTAVFGTGYYLS
jgi:hypothetical protein